MNLDQEQINGALETVESVSSEMIPNMDDWLPETSEEEGGVMLCNVQLREGMLLEELIIHWNGLANSETTELTLLIKEYRDIFALNPYEVGRTEVVHHAINTASYPSIKHAPCRIPFSLRPKVEALIEEMLDQGIVEESSSPWASKLLWWRKQIEVPGFVWITSA